MRGGGDMQSIWGLYSVEKNKLLDTVKWDDKGLAVAITQNVDTGAILMQGFANREALTTTTSTRKATFYSSSLWIKGETSMNFINVHNVYLDCDRDSADELWRTLEENENKSRAASEMADVLYHALVLLAVKDVKVEDVFQVLRQRFSKSGIEEKSSRKST
ncbi:hypothetical protein Syun_030996 [Stephania yunnanensis]|uniref:Phosphoribosyl-AMP cyclohydrolase domain-containing protein n=1 Tax=Stephania yunnanensis TaxID=152371 RepID=A0AAP0E3H5_9MAGN